MKPKQSTASRGNLLVVSHPCVVPANQAVYRELRGRGWDVHIVVPKRWSHAYSDDVRPTPLEGMDGTLVELPVLGRGRVQRHVHLARAGAVIDRFRPDVAFLEMEAYALAATQWGRALSRRGVPFGVQCYENINRPLPSPVRWMRSRVLREAAFVAARSRTAGELAQSWGATGEVGLAPPGVPLWQPRPARDERPFTIGYAGRLTEAKGVRDLLAAAAALPTEHEVLLFGDGDLARALERPGVRVVSGIPHERMDEAYAQMDVLALPSHTTATWKEQFGRVLIEALSCGVPVVGSSSGEIPWVIELTEGGLVFPEGDVQALSGALERLARDAELRRTLAATGRANVERLFSEPAAATQLERLLLFATGAAATHSAKGAQ